MINGTITALGQGTVAFSGPLGSYGTNYFEQGMVFRMVIPTRGSGDPSYDSMVLASIPTAGNIPYSTTPYMAFFRQFSPDDYISFSLINGYSFGLTSVNLADPNSPSSSLVPISFIGFLANGSSVTNTFTTPGNGATTFQNFLFTSAFASGLTSVDIFSTRWAMDNLVFGNVAPVPEPGTMALLGAGVAGWLARRRCARSKK